MTPPRTCVEQRREAAGAICTARVGPKDAAVNGLKPRGCIRGLGVLVRYVPPVTDPMDMAACRKNSCPRGEEVGARQPTSTWCVGELTMYKSNRPS